MRLWNIGPLKDAKTCRAIRASGAPPHGNRPHPLHKNTDILLADRADRRDLDDENTEQVLRVMSDADHKGDKKPF